MADKNRALCPWYHRGAVSQRTIDNAAVYINRADRRHGKPCPLPPDTHCYLFLWQLKLKSKLQESAAFPAKSQQNQT